MGAARDVDSEVAAAGGFPARARFERRGKFFSLVDQVRNRIEFGDLLLYFYLVTLARQCLWSVPNQRFAWTVTLLLAALAWAIYLTAKETPEERPGRQFWLVVGLPLLFVYSLRVVFPDVSFDVLNHHLFLSERALRGPLLLPGDFFPTPAPYNPAPDMLTGIFRYYLGYRLGTIINLLVLLWAAEVLYKLLRPYVRDNWRRALAVLLCMLAEHLLFEINNYMVDLIALPLTLEATRLALTVDSWENYRRRLVRIAFLCGLAVTMKLTNMAMVAPIIFVCAGFALFKFRPRVKNLAVTSLLTLVAFFAPLLPYSIYIYRITRSPFFPVYNGIFKSPYWPVSNVWDPRWGAHGVRGVLMWPLILRSRPEQLSELNVYSGRITVAIIAIFLFLVLRWRNTDAQTLSLCFMVLLTVLLWSITSGYIRYGLHLEALAGVVMIMFAVQLGKGASLKKQPWRLALSTLVLMALVAQASLACTYLLRAEWSMRPTIFDNPHAYRISAKYVMRDYSLTKYLTPQEKAMFNDVEVWVVTGGKTVGPEALLKLSVPFIGVRTPEYFETAAGVEKFQRALDQQEGKRIRSLCFPEDFELTKNTLRAVGLDLGKVVPIQIPFFAPNHRIPMFFFEVTRTRQPEAKKPVAPEPSNALPDAGYLAAFSPIEAPAVFKPGEKRKVVVKVRNAGTSVWPSKVPHGWMNTVTVGDRWLTADASGVVNQLDSRSALPHDLKPGDEVEIILTVTAPLAEGQYVLEIDMVHEGVTWFYQRGSQTLRWPVKVVPVTQFER